MNNSRKREEAECPVCQGSSRVPLPEFSRKHANFIAGYDPATDTLPCRNCGGQYMSPHATGRTTIDPATGKGCVHSYQHRLAGNCYHEHTCSKCLDQYYIDSGDR